MNLSPTLSSDPVTLELPLSCSATPASALPLHSPLPPTFQSLVIPSLQSTGKNPAQAYLQYCTLGSFSFQNTVRISVVINRGSVQRCIQNVHLRSKLKSLAFLSAFRIQA